nr:methyltransferase [Tanacetum cinerariifolium]
MRISSLPSKSSNSTEEKRKLLKQYYVDRDVYLSEPTRKKGRRKNNKNMEARSRPKLKQHKSKLSLERS